MWRGQQPIVGLVLASLLLGFLSTVVSQCHLHAHDGETGGTDSEEIQGAEEVAFVDGATYNTTQDKPCGKRVHIQGGKFLMGSDDKYTYPMDGESPVREESVGTFEMSACETTNAEFLEFVTNTNYTTEAETFGWSFIFVYFVSEKTLESITQAVAAAPHWVPVEGAYWRHPEGPDSTIEEGRLDHPVVHISWNDAKRYCEWGGGRLPTEKEWEYAARGGLEGKRYPWGDETIPRGEKGEPVYPCNFFQGKFPDKNTEADGYAGTAPAWAYSPNGYGLYNVAGNVWEWCDEDWSIDHSPAGQQRQRLSRADSQQEVRKVQKGGSYLCHVRVCHRFRAAARMGNTPDSSAGNLGFRCVWDV